MSRGRVLLTVPNLRSIFGDANAIPGHPHTGIAYLIPIFETPKAGG